MNSHEADHDDLVKENSIYNMLWLLSALSIESAHYARLEVGVVEEFCLRFNIVCTPLGAW